jgi:hypothetical protein
MHHRYTAAPFGKRNRDNCLEDPQRSCILIYRSSRFREIRRITRLLSKVVDVSQLSDQISCAYKPREIICRFMCLIIGHRETRMFDVDFNLRSRSIIALVNRSRTKVWNERRDTASLTRRWLPSARQPYLPQGWRHTGHFRLLGRYLIRSRCRGIAGFPGPRG